MNRTYRWTSGWTSRCGIRYGYGASFALKRPPSTITKINLTSRFASRCSSGCAIHYGYRAWTFPHMGRFCWSLSYVVLLKALVPKQHSGQECCGPRIERGAGCKALGSFLANCISDKSPPQIPGGRNHGVLQGAQPRGRQLYCTFPSAPDPLFKASKAPFLSENFRLLQGSFGPFGPKVANRVGKWVPGPCQPQGPKSPKRSRKRVKIPSESKWLQAGKIIFELFSGALQENPVRAPGAIT